MPSTEDPTFARDWKILGICRGLVMFVNAETIPEMLDADPGGELGSMSMELTSNGKFARDIIRSLLDQLDPGFASDLERELIGNPFDQCLILAQRDNWGRLDEEIPIDDPRIHDFTID